MDIKAAIRRSAEQRTVVARLARQELFAGMAKRIRELPQPVIAAVNGPAAGAGMGISLAADIRIASRVAEFLVASIRIGITAGECGISYNLPRLIGASRAFDVMLTGRPIGAERIGLVCRVVEADQLTHAAQEMAHAILANSPFGVTQTIKGHVGKSGRLQYRCGAELENRAQLVAVHTEDYAEASLAFAEKGKARFKGAEPVENQGPS
jgi:enoyl-CoA hydratase